MKRIKLLFAALAAMVGLTAQAGEGWTAPGAPAASDPVSGQTYKIRNVETGRYLSGGSAWFSWSTSAILADVNSALEWTITGSESAGYTLACNRSGNNKLFTSGNGYAEQCMHVDGASATTYFFEKQASGHYRIRENDVTGKYVGGPDASNGVLAQVDPANPSVSTICCDWEFVPLSALTVYGPTVAYAEVRASVLGYVDMTDIYTDANDAVATLKAGVYAQDDVVDAATTADEVNAAATAVRNLILPFISSVTIKDGKYFDITSFITNPSFESGFTGWTNSGMATQGNNSFAGKVGSTYAEAWQPNGTKSVSQALQGLPAGYYTLSANILARTVTSAKLYAGAAEVSATIGDVTNSYSVVFNCSDNDNVTVGFEAVGTGAGASWVAIDGIKLSYLGKAPLVLFQNELAAAVAAARTHATGLAVPAAALTAYNDAIDAAEANNATIVDCQAGIPAIEAATATVDAFVAPYATYLIEKANAQFAGVAVATINGQDAIVAAATQVSEIQTATATLQSCTNDLAYDVTTFTIKNPTAQDKTYWEGTDFGDKSNGVCEYWNKSGAGFHQTVNLPAGKYRMTVIALQRLNMTGTVYAGENSTVIAQVGNPPVNSRSQAAEWFAAGNGKNYVNFTLDAAADVVIGLKADATMSDYWTVWQSFKLETFDESVAASFLAPGFAEAVAAAQAIHDDAAYANVSGSEKTNFEAAIAANPSTVAEYEAAINDLNTTSAAFTAAKKNYDLYASELTIAQAISTTLTVAAPTTSEEALAAFKTLKVAEYNYVATAYPYSATSKIGEFSTWTRTGTVNGVEKNEFEALTSQHWSGTAMTYYEQPATGWDNNAWTANYEKKTTLPAGEYIIKVAARAASSGSTTANISCQGLTAPIPTLGDTGKGITTAGVASFDEGTFANNGNGRGWVWSYLPFTLTAETEVTMTVVAKATGKYQWFSVCDGELLSKTNIATPVSYDEDVDNNIEDVDVANVTMNRTIKASYNTVVLPFDLTANQVQAAFGSGTVVYAFSENSANDQDVEISFNSIVEGTISANVPVLVKATVASAEQVFEGVQIVAPTEGVKVAGTNVDFVGVYAPATVKADDYFVGNGALYKSAGNTNINAFRAYIDAKEGVEAKMFIDGLETSINAINGVEAEQGVIFNLAGQRVQKAQKGIYVINGKKVLVK
jgi:hypothetical protein